MPCLSLSCFGSPGIILDGEPVSALNTKTQALLCYLAVEAERPHRRESLAGLLWPEQPEPAAHNSLRQALHQLRHAIGETFLRVTPLTVQFNPASDCALDVSQFTTLVAASETHAHRSRETCRACIKRLQSAAELYRGDFLADLFLKDSAPFEEWVLVKREQFVRMMLSTLERLVAYHARRGDYAQMEQMARRQIAMDSFRESAHIKVMHALAWQGERCAAIAQYQACRRLLKEEFGIEPSRETTELYEQIRDGKLQRPRLPVSTNVPIPLTTLIGRTREIDQVKKLLETTRLLILTGAGGCGKTRLAIEVARNLVEEFPDGVWYVELASLTNPALVLARVATALQMHEQAGDTSFDQVMDDVRAKQLLLVLDNCEHLLQACAEFADSVLRVAPQVQLLVTSRETLGIVGEHVYRVPSLRIPERDLAPQVLAQVESVELFVTRAAAVQPRFALTDANAAAVAHICRQLDGIPLAIELAAARTQALSVEEIGQRLTDQFDLLTGVSRTALPRHQTLRTTIEWSYQLLTAQERLLMDRLAVFVGGWTVAAAESVCAGDGLTPGQVLDLLSRLVDKSLVMVEVPNGAARYRMLEVVRAYAHEKLAESGDWGRVRDRHLDFFLKLAQEAEPKLLTDQQAEWIKRLERDYDNLRAAMAWSQSGASGEGASQTSQTNKESGLRLAVALWLFWTEHHLHEGREFLESQLSQGVEQCPLDLHAKALMAAADLADRQGDFASARTHWEASLALQQETGNLPAIARARRGLGNVAFAQRDFDSAREFYEASLAICREIGDMNGVASNLNNLGLVMWNKGECATARKQLEESLALRQKQGDRGGAAYTLNLLGFVAWSEEDYVTMCALNEASLAIQQELNDQWSMAYSFDGLGLAASGQGDLELACSYYKKSLALFRELGAKLGIADSLERFAVLACARAQPIRSALLFGAAEALREALSSPLQQAERMHHDRTVATARSTNPEAFAAAWAQGRAMSLEQAIAYVLEGMESEQ